MPFRPGTSGFLQCFSRLGERKPKPDADAAGAVEAVVRASYDAFRDRDRARADSLLAADFTFTSPYDDAIDKTAFFTRCWPNGDRFAAFTVETVLADETGAFVTYLIKTKDGSSFRNTEYLRVKNGKITSVDVYFGATYRDGTFESQEKA